MIGANQAISTGPRSGLNCSSSMIPLLRQLITVFPLLVTVSMLIEPGAISFTSWLKDDRPTADSIHISPGTGLGTGSATDAVPQIALLEMILSPCKL